MLSSSIPSILDSPPQSSSRWRLLPSYQSNKIVKIISILLITFYICLSNNIISFPSNAFYRRYLSISDSNRSSSYSSMLSSDGQMRQDKQIFQITLTGVPNRLPTVIESMFLEGALIESLKEALSPRGIRLNSARVKLDKTIHYQRSLDEDFNVAGISFVPPGSNSSSREIEIDNDFYMQVMDEETMTRINEMNRRVLAMTRSKTNADADADADITTSIYQLSLLVTIVGTYPSSSALDYSSTIWSAINQNQMNIVESLLNPSPGTHGAEYFDQVQFMVCVGIGLRDADDPVLEMVNSSSSSNKDKGASSITGNTSTGVGSSSNSSRGSGRANDNSDSGSTESFSSSGGDTGESRSEYNPQEQNGYEYGSVPSSASQEITSMDSALVNLETTNNSYGTSRTDNGENNPSAYERDDDVSGQDKISTAFNPGASRFQLVSGIVFLVLCCVALLSNVVRVAAKKAAERKKRLAIAKKAYEGTGHEASKGNRTFFNRYSKYTGTMDTGAGLQ